MNNHLIHFLLIGEGVLNMQGVEFCNSPLT